MAEDLLYADDLDWRENKITGKVDEPETRDEHLALSDIINRLGEKITLDEMRQLSRPQIESKLSPDVKKVLGADPEFILENRYGDKHKEDAKGNVVKFTYVDRLGDEVQTFDKIQRDKAGKVMSFQEYSTGRKWLRSDSIVDGWEPEYSASKWIAINKNGERSKFLYNLGSVSFDRDGVHVTGSNPAALGVPRRRL